MTLITVQRLYNIHFRTHTVQPFSHPIGCWDVTPLARQTFCWLRRLCFEHHPKSCAAMPDALEMCKVNLSMEKLISSSYSPPYHW